MHKYLCFVFYVNISDYDCGPRGGWFDFVGARRTIEEARECVEDKWDNGENYQIVDAFELKVVEEGEVSNQGAITFAERDRREKTMKQAQALRFVGATYPSAPHVEIGERVKYGEFILERGTL
jgi:hypothetical protein